MGGERRLKKNFVGWEKNEAADVYVSATGVWCLSRGTTRIHPDEVPPLLPVWDGIPQEVQVVCKICCRFVGGS